MSAPLLVGSVVAPGTTIILDCPQLPGGALPLTASAGYVRHLELTKAKTDAALGLGAAAGTPAGAMAIARTAGTSLTLVGEATSSSAKTDTCNFEVQLPDSYQAGAAIPVIVNGFVAGSGTLTVASTTVTLTAYSEIQGVETALTVTGGTAGAQRFDKTPATGTIMTWSVAGTGLSPGQRIWLNLSVLVTSSAGANTGTINDVSITA